MSFPLSQLMLTDGMTNLVFIKTTGTSCDKNQTLKEENKEVKP